MSGTQEFTVKIPQRNEKKNYYVMKFNSSLAVDVAKWSQVRNDNFLYLSKPL